MRESERERGLTISEMTVRTISCTASTVSGSGSFASPKPCINCSTEHHSIRKGEEQEESRRESEGSEGVNGQASTKLFRFRFRGFR